VASRACVGREQPQDARSTMTEPLNLSRLREIVAAATPARLRDAVARLAKEGA
jgi:hypothetical protein